jgi:branched-chain amino acid transport system ATP-binding protein
MTFMTGENMIGGYGSVDILNGCSICVDRGEIAVVVGPN